MYIMPSMHGWSILQNRTVKLITGGAVVLGCIGASCYLYTHGQGQYCWWIAIIAFSAIPD